jgi:4-carboxymuconolactone decarboxylase
MKLLAAILASLPIAMTALAQSDLTIARSGSQASRPGPAENFTGAVRVDPLFTARESTRAAGSYVTFQPGARTAWHTHPHGQTLIVTAGVGRVQRWGAALEEIRPGDVVWIPPGVKHWHGASQSSAMTHIAVTEHQNGKTVDWAEQVSDDQYGLKAPVPPTGGQRVMGDINPKLAELTDNVLFGDVWARPGLTPRDRSLATVSALIAMNRPDQLRSHLARARDNGLTEAELIEAITHLAFYAGWPSGVTASQVAREVFKK